MKLVYVLLILGIAVSTLGCMGNRQSESITSAPVAPVETSVSPAATFVPGSEDPFGTDADIAALDSLLADSTMDISLMDSI